MRKRKAPSISSATQASLFPCGAIRTLPSKRSLSSSSAASYVTHPLLPSASSTFSLTLSLPRSPFLSTNPFPNATFPPTKWSFVLSFSPFHLVVQKENPLDAIYIMRGVSPEPFSVTLFGSAPMETVYERYLEHFLGHKPNKQEMRGHVLVRSVSPTFILPRDCRLSESDVQNGDVLEGSGKRLT